MELESFIGGAAVGFFIRELLRRMQRRAEVGRDGIVDLMQVIRLVEEAYRRHTSAANHRPADWPSAAGDLVGEPCAVRISGPLLPLERYLDCLDDDDAHDIALRTFDLAQQLDAWSDEAEVSYRWLLEHPCEWESAAGQEYREALREQIEGVKETCWALLAEGYSFVYKLLHVRGFSLFRALGPDRESLLSAQAGLTVAEVGRRKGYYAWPYRPGRLLMTSADGWSWCCWRGSGLSPAETRAGIRVLLNHGGEEYEFQLNQTVLLPITAVGQQVALGQERRRVWLQPHAPERASPEKPAELYAR